MRLASLIVVVATCGTASADSWEENVYAVNKYDAPRAISYFYKTAKGKWVKCGPVTVPAGQAAHFQRPEPADTTVFISQDPAGSTFRAYGDVARPKSITFARSEKTKQSGFANDNFDTIVWKTIELAPNGPATPTGHPPAAMLKKATGATELQAGGYPFYRVTVTNEFATWVDVQPTVGSTTFTKVRLEALKSNTFATLTAPTPGTAAGTIAARLRVTDPDGKVYDINPAGGIRATRTDNTYSVAARKQDAAAPPPAGGNTVFDPNRTAPPAANQAKITVTVRNGTAARVPFTLDGGLATLEQATSLDAGQSKTFSVTVAQGRTPTIRVGGQPNGAAARGYTIENGGRYVLQRNGNAIVNAIDR
ncbi:MAG TPA: hypothetical protein VD866_32010 [Urbifossiella sp.]|nr:hypothetical protein [Urbifossiella sp.]